MPANMTTIGVAETHCHLYDIDLKDRDAFFDYMIDAKESIPGSLNERPCYWYEGRPKDFINILESYKRDGIDIAQMYKIWVSDGRPVK